MDIYIIYINTQSNKSLTYCVIFKIAIKKAVPIRKLWTGHHIEKMEDDIVLCTANVSTWLFFQIRRPWFIFTFDWQPTNWGLTFGFGDRRTRKFVHRSLIRSAFCSFLILQRSVHAHPIHAMHIKSAHLFEGQRVKYEKDLKSLSLKKRNNCL